MKVLSVAYSRINLLDDSCDSEYQYETNRIAYDIYEKVTAAVPEIKRVDVVITNDLWLDSGEQANVIRFSIDNRLNLSIKVDHCFLVGAAAAAAPIIQQCQARLRKVRQEGLLCGSFS
jgi:hypothetical protein